MSQLTGLWILCLLFVLILAVTILALMMLTVKMLKAEHRIHSLTMQDSINRLSSENQNLLTRIQSGDLRTYLSLTSNSENKPEVEYHVKNDAAELAILGTSEGLGEGI